ncbi:MAG TPA: class I adenylate-forming enzyme family protein [Geminicoccaceae bacterium]
MHRLLTLHHPAAARGYYEAGTWTSDTFYSLVQKHAAARPEAHAARDSARRLTWRELLGWIDVVAGELEDAGVREGERVGLWLSNRLEAVVAFIACARNGYVCNPSLHRNYTVDDVRRLLERIDARVVMIEDGWGADVDRHDPGAAFAGLPSLARIVRLPRERLAATLSRRAGSGPRSALSPEGEWEDPSLPGTPSLDGEGHGGRAPPGGADHVAYLAFTSGTTGTPKGVMHSSNTLLANCRDLARDWGHDERTVLLTLSPVSHHIAWVALGQAMTAGAEFVLDDPPAGMSRLDWIRETGATYVMGVPTHAMDILAEQRRRGIDRLGRVRVFYMAGAPIPPAVAERFLAQGITPQNIYGMTENSSHHYTHPDDDAATVCTTCGRGGPAYEVRIFDQNDRDRMLGPDQAGEIGGRGAALMLGYFDNQRATETSFNRDGWFMSGDLGVLDAAGNLRIVGRLKDIVIRGGHNIHPARVEELAVRHPLVDKAAAFAVPDERLGERLCLAVSRTGEATPEPDDLLRHLDAAGLSRFDMPEYFIVMDAFPLTASGKILKRELAVWAADGRIAPTPCRFRNEAREQPGGR